MHHECRNPTAEERLEKTVPEHAQQHKVNTNTKGGGHKRSQWPPNFYISASSAAVEAPPAK
jgi:hypothetical protein